MLQVDPSHFLGPSSYDLYILVILFCLKQTKRKGTKICRNKEIMYKSCKLVLFGSVRSNFFLEQNIFKCYPI